MLTFKTLRFKNFISYGNVFTELDLSRSESTLIIGKNGEGKSTFLDAITFALYGKAFRKIKKDQLINSMNEKDCLVELEFTANNGHYKVRRGIKPTIFEVYFNGELLNQDNKNRDYQKILETQILKQSYRSFTQIEILGSAKYQPFMELPTFARREITEELLDLSVFSIMADTIKETIGQHKSQLTELNSEVSQLKRSISENEEFISHIENNKENQIKEFKNELESIEDKLRSFSKNIKEIDGIFSAKVVSDEILSNKKSYIENIKSKIRESKNDLNKSLKELNFFKSNDICPTCSQSIDSEFKAHSCEEIDSETVRMKEEISILEAELEERTNEYQNELEFSISMKEKRSKAFSELQSQNNYMIKIKDKILSLENTEDVSYKEYQEKLDNLVNTLNESIEKYKKGISKLKYYDICLKLSSDSGIKSKIISTYLPMLNNLINKYLSMMDFYISFYLDENFDETIKSRFRDKFSYSSFSEGEKSRINLAILFAFIEIAKIKNSISANILCMDEIFDSSMDAEGVDFLTKLLKESNMNVFIISHNARMQDKFSRTLIAEKVSNFSVLKEL